MTSDVGEGGDLSRYTEVARLVEGAMGDDPSPWLGMFTDHESTKLWQRRFLEPGPWMDPDLA